MMVFLINSVIIGSLIYFLSKLKVQQELEIWYYPTLLIKVLAGLGVGLVYYYHYGYGDTITYHEDAMRMTALFSQNIESYVDILAGNAKGNSNFNFVDQPRAFFLVKILSIVHLITADNYWLSSVYFSLFSFLGFWLLTNTLVIHFPKKKMEIIIALLLFPSVVFWSSGIIKESLALGGLTLLLMFLLDWYFTKNTSLKSIIPIALSLVLVWQLKYYYIGVFLIIAIPLILTEWYVRRSAAGLKSHFMYAASILTLAFIVSWLHPNFYLENILGVIVDNHDLYVLGSRQDQLIQYSSLEPTLISITLNFPLAVWSGLFRIGIWESNQSVEYLVALENIVLLVLTIASLWRLHRIKIDKHALLVFSALLYITLLAGFLALSTPNLGTLARYRVGFLPVFVLLIFINNPIIDLLKSKFVGNVEDIPE